MPARKRCAFLNSRLLSVASRSLTSLSTSLRYRYYLDTVLFTRPDIFLTVEAPIRTIKPRRLAERLLVTSKRPSHLLFVGRIAIENCILRNQTHRAFRKKNLVAELNRSKRFTAFN